MSTSKSKQTLSDRYSSGSGNTGNHKASGGRFISKPLLIAIVSIVSIVSVIIIVSSIGGKGMESNNASNYNLVVTASGVDEAVVQNQEIPETVPAQYTASMNSEWEFYDSRSASENAYVANVTLNTHPVNFVVKRDDTGTVIYESPDMPVGTQLSNIKLDDETLTAGTYPCTLTYRLLDKDRNEVSHVNISISIIIKND